MFVDSPFKGDHKMNLNQRHNITIPSTLAFAFAIGACSWAFNTLQIALGHDAASSAMEADRTREIDTLTHRVEQLERNAYDRGCGRDH